MVNSREKGIKFEKLVARELRGLYPEARRSYGQSRCGSDAPDVEGTPFRVECGHGKRMNPAAKYAQAVRDGAGDLRPPIAICRVDRGPITVTMGLDTFKRMLLIPKAE